MTDYDYTALGPINYDQSKVPAEIKEYTDYTRSKALGEDVRESIARAGEIAGVVAREASEIATTASNLSVATQNRFNDQIAGNTDINEVIDARRPVGGEAYTTLGERLNASENYSLQMDFVSQIANMIGGYEQMYYKRENTPGWVTVMLRNKSDHITWTFRNNTYDDFYILGDCFSGTVTSALAIYQDKNYGTTTGTWVATAPNTHYATSVGATMTTYIDGEKIEFHHYADDRGGIWEFVVDDDTTNKVTISTWSATAVATNTKTLFEGLDFGTHKVVGTFKGDDPAHTPSSGAGTSRGWVYVNGANNYLTFRAFKTQLTNNRVQDLLVGFSNKEFAFRTRKTGTTHAYQFVPMHNSVGTAFEKTPVQFIADSTILSEADILALTIGEFYEITKFSVVQSVYGRNPESSDENLIEINTNVTISKNGNVEITGKMQPLVNVDIENGYGIMFPVVKSATTKAVTSKGNTYATTKTDGTSTYLIAENDTTTSVAFVADSNKNYISAVRFNDIKNTLKTGKDKGDTPFWIEHRDANMQKLYFRQLNNASLTPNDIFKFSATFNCGKVIDIYNLI